MIGFNLQLTDMRARAEIRRNKVRACIDPERGGKIDLIPQGSQTARFAIISRNVDQNEAERATYPWRVTMFDDRGPWGHTVHKTLDGEPGYAYSTSAIQEVALNISLKEG